MYKLRNTTKLEHYQIFNNPIVKTFSSQPNIYFIAKFRVSKSLEKFQKWPCCELQQRDRQKPKKKSIERSIKKSWKLD